MERPTDAIHRLDAAGGIVARAAAAGLSRAPAPADIAQVLDWLNEIEKRLALVLEARLAGRSPWPCPFCGKALTLTSDSRAADRYTCEGCGRVLQIATVQFMPSPEQPP
jgi:hypothetical protein